MGCTQAQNVNRIQIAPLGQDPESLKQFYAMQKEQQELQQKYEGDAMAAGNGSEMPEKLIRKDWAKLKQTLAPKNTIQLISCEALEPLLAQAFGNDQELRQRVIKLYLKSTKTPKSQLNSKANKEQYFGTEESKKAVGEAANIDEVKYCVRVAQEQVALFRKKSKIADLCHQLTKTFADILRANPQLKVRAPKQEMAADGSYRQGFSSPLPLKWNDSWYNRFSYVLLSELASFAPIFQLILKKGDSLLEKAQQSVETTYFYCCAMVTIRFLEGTSWGYSEMLMHQELDKETVIALRVCYNLLLRLKQGYREDKQIGPVFHKDEDVAAVYFPEPVFQRIYSHNQLDKLICMQSRDEFEQLGDLKNLNDNSGSFQYLDNQIFRKTYIGAKKEIDDWLRIPSYMKSGGSKSTKGDETTGQAKKPVVDRDETEFLTQLKESSTRQDFSAADKTKAASENLQLTSDIINVAQYKHRDSIRTLTRDFIRQLKNPDLNLDGSLKPKADRKTSNNARQLNTLHYDQSDPFSFAQSQIGKQQEQRLNAGADDGKPSFEIDNSRNVMLLLGAATDTRVILESFLQANVRMRSKYKCTVLHCCTRENKLTHDSYYIVKHIITQIVRTVPAVRNLLLLQKHDYFREFLTSKASLNKQLKLQQEAPAMLVKFFKILQQVKLDFNICVFITGIENVFDINDLQNIVYVLRSLTCNSLYMPLYMRFVLTAERRESKAKNFDTLVRLLQTKKIIDVHDHKFFESEGPGLVDFVYQYTQTLHSQNRLKIQGHQDENGATLLVPEASPEERASVVDAVLVKSQSSYRIVIDILSKLDLAGIYLIQVKGALKAIQTYQSDHIRFLPQLEGAIESSDGNDRVLTRTMLQVLTQICGPISFSLFARICNCLLIAKLFIKQKHGKDGDDIEKIALQKQPVSAATQKLLSDYNAINNEGHEKRALSAMIEQSAEQSEATATLEHQKTGGSTIVNNDYVGVTTLDLNQSSGKKQTEDKKEGSQPVEEEKEPAKLRIEITKEKDDASASPTKVDLANRLGLNSDDKEFPNASEDQPAADVPAADVKGVDPKVTQSSVDITKVMMHVQHHGNLDLPLEQDFVERLTQKLLAISEFVHFVTKERINYRRPGGHDGESDSRSDEEDERDSALNELRMQNDALGILQHANSLLFSGETLESYQLFSEIQQKLMIVPRKRKMVKACMSVLKVQKSRYFDAMVQLITLDEFGGPNPLNGKENESAPSWRQTASYETIDPYLRLYIYHHWAKSPAQIKFTSFQNLLTVENIFKQIVYFGSYDRYRWNLMLIYKRKGIESSESQGITYLINTLHLVQQTLKYEPINYLDFCTQMRGRTLGDAGSRNLPDMKFSDLVQNSAGSSDVCYFENFHHALRENPRIDLVLQFQGCQILTLKFFSDKKRIMVSLSNGLLLLYNTETHAVMKVYAQSHAVIDKVKIIDDRYIICAGIDSKHRIWNVENQRQVSKFEMHGYCTSQIVIYKEFLITYGYSRSLVKFNFMKKQYQCWLETASYLTNLKLLKTNDKAHPVKLIASFADGDIVLYSVDLAVLCHINRSVQEPVLRIICLSLSESLCFYRDGQISVMSGVILEETKAGSIFSLKSDDYIDMILIKSREYFLFTIEKQKIEFFNASTFKRSDSWDYFFERDIVGCDKNKEGSKICVWDKGGYLTLFNFLKHLDNTQKQYNTPSHRRYDPVVCIDVTERLGEKNQVISCSLERDLRVWSRDTGLFLKKYDLSSFTAENVSTIRLGKSEGMLFLGSKDMNVYLIDVARGKLCVVYEGHWSRVTSIYTLPGRDILVTLSESNIKVWDLEYDECIKNMNDHSSLIVYCALSHDDDSRIVTISQSLEYKEWSYVTGDIVKQFAIDLSNVRDTGDDDVEDDDSSSGASESESDSDSNESQSDLNPQGDDQAERHQQRQRTPKPAKTSSHQPERKQKNLVACHVSANGFAYLAIDTNKIIVFNLETKEIQSVFESYQGQTVIYLTSVETARSDYLIVVTRTSCVLYALLEDGVRRMTSYLINSRKRPYRSLDENRFSYSVRFYFTAAKVIRAQDESDPMLGTAGQSTQNAVHNNTGKGLKQTGGFGLLGSDFTMGQAGADGAVSESAFEYQSIGMGNKSPDILVQDDASYHENLHSIRMRNGGVHESSLKLMAQNNALTYKNAIDSLSVSPLPAHRDLAITLQRNTNVWNYASQPGLEPQQHQLQNNLMAGKISSALSENYHPLYESGLAAQSMAQLGATGALGGGHENMSMAGMTESRKREKYLVYLGDSRGQVHMTSLYLS